MGFLAVLLNSLLRRSGTLALADAAAHRMFAVDLSATVPDSQPKRGQSDHERQARLALLPCDMFAQTLG
jgi:hypothetical protein